MDTDEAAIEEKRLRWLTLAANRPPEWLATYVASPTASTVVVTGGQETGDLPCSAYLESMDDVPYWGLALAKSYLDDAGEWPLLGMHVEYALMEYTEHGDPERALMEIVSTIRKVWSDVNVLFVGEGKH
ncbi:MAG: hypothetical protein HQL73_13355 [Magnetococcales bacterium]|nr:hypothetical protein [Magnetococcales bacterium]